MAAAMSTAILSVYYIYFPAYAILLEKAKNNAAVMKEIVNFLAWKYMGATVFFIIVLLIFPIMLLSVFSIKHRTIFINRFVEGVAAKTK